jgi:hypothetical protein
MAPRPTPIQDAREPDTEEPAPVPDFTMGRSSEAVDFHVHKQILFVSAFFANLLGSSFPTNATELRRDGKPILVLSDPSDVLSRLWCLYPARSRQLPRALCELRA